MHLGWVSKTELYWLLDANAASCRGANLLHQTDQLSWNKARLQQSHYTENIARGTNGTNHGIWNELQILNGTSVRI